MMPEDATVEVRVELVHCGEPMVWRGSSTTWEGAPGQGHTVDTTRWVCGQCGATAEVTVRTPS